MDMKVQVHAHLEGCKVGAAEHGGFMPQLLLEGHAVLQGLDGHEYTGVLLVPDALRGGQRIDARAQLGSGLLKALQPGLEQVVQPANALVLVAGWGTALLQSNENEMNHKFIVEKDQNSAVEWTPSHALTP